MRVLVTGATGFVGTALVKRMLLERRYTVRLATRRRDASPEVDQVQLDLDSATNWPQALIDVHAVVHLAARVHVMRDTAADPLQEFRRVNVAGTLNLAQHAAAAGVRRFVYLSSVKVHGESGAYRETDPPAPADAYGVSKHEAEVGLRAIEAATGMEVVIIRPPLVYGPGVRANMRALVGAVARGVPLPLGAVHNRRSLVALENLVDFILTCLEHQAAAGDTFLVSDGEDLSTTDLIRRLARAMGRPARLIPVPALMLLAGAMLVGQGAAARRLLGTLQFDTSKARQQLAWNPPLSVDEALRRMVTAP